MMVNTQNQASVFSIHAENQNGLAFGTDRDHRRTSATRPYAGNRRPDSTLFGTDGLGGTGAETGEGCSKHEQLSLRERSEVLPTLSRIPGDPPAAVWAMLVINRVMSS